MAKIDLTVYKVNIALPDFLIKEFGYSVQAGTSQNSVRLENEAGHLIVIGKNSKGYYTYFEPHTNVKGATIIDFMQKYIANQRGIEKEDVFLSDVIKILDTYIKSKQVVLDTESKFYLANVEHSPDFIYKEVQGMKTLSKTNAFLADRGITDKTLQSKEFEGIFKSKLYRKDSTVYENTCVIMSSDTSKFNAYSHRGEGFKGCVGSRNSLATSNHDRTRPVDIYFVAESMIDAISHFQMNQKKLEGKNVVYFSTEGSLINGQIDILQKSINVIKPNNIVSLFDRDIAGLIYTLKLHGNIIQPNDRLMENVSMDITIDKNNNEAKMKFFVKTKDLKESITNQIQRIIEDARIKLSSDNSNISLNALREADNYKEIEVTIPYNPQSLIAAQEHLENIRSQHNYLSYERPLSNDFNDDLRLKQGNHPNWSVQAKGGKYFIVQNKNGKSFSRELNTEEIQELNINQNLSTKGYNI